MNGVLTLQWLIIFHDLFISDSESKGTWLSTGTSDNARFSTCTSRIISIITYYLACALERPGPPTTYFGSFKVIIEISKRINLRNGFQL